VYLHIGPPKTGTTYLQDVLWRNRRRLAEHQVTLPGTRPVDHFRAALDVRGIAFGGYEDPRTSGAWPRLAREVLAAPTSASVVSHEVFAGADEGAVSRVVTDLSGADVHVVYGARDLARQLPAVWQESLKNRRTRPYEAFLQRALRDGAESGQPGFWRAQNVLSTLDRWSGPVPPDRIHVITLPRPGAAPDTLWQRFAAVLGITAQGYDLDVSRSNASLSTVDAEMLRRLNEALPAELPWPDYERLVKRRFNRRADAAQPGERLRVPAEYRDRVFSLAHETVSGLKESGFDIVGDLDDLIPDQSSFGVLDEVQPDRVTQAALAMLADVVTDERGRGRPRPHQAALTMLGRLRRARGRGRP
jgi:hypothetical protein